MSTSDLSSCTPSSEVTSSAPLPIPMHISSPEQHTTHLPGHLRLGEHNFLQSGKVTEEIAHVALATTDSWGFPLSPTSVQNVLTAIPNPSPDQFWSIILWLANTIWIRDNVHQEKVKGLEAQLVVLQQRVDNKDDGLAECPPGYKENWEQFPNFTIPLDNSTEQFTCFIKQLNDGRVTGLHSRAKGEQETQIIELYASPDYTTDKPMEPLPCWICHWLWGNHATYTILEDAINDLNNWGLLANIHHYCQYNQEHTYLVQKMELLEADIQTMCKSRHQCEEWLVTPALLTRSNTFQFISWWAPSNQPGRRGPWLGLLVLLLTKDNDIFI